MKLNEVVFIGFTPKDLELLRQYFIGEEEYTALMGDRISDILKIDLISIFLSNKAGCRDKSRREQTMNYNYRSYVPTQEERFRVFLKIQERLMKIAIVENGYTKEEARWMLLLYHLGEINAS